MFIIIHNVPKRCYCDQPFFVHVCLYIWLVGCSCVPLGTFIVWVLIQPSWQNCVHCLLSVKHECKRQFMAGKTLSQLSNNILPYFLIFFLYNFCSVLVPSFSLSKDKYPRTNIVLHYNHYYYPAAIGKKLNQWKTKTLVIKSKQELPWHE